jgi:hypothetical protein
MDGGKQGRLDQMEGNINKSQVDIMANHLPLAGQVVASAPLCQLVRCLVGRFEAC